MSNRPNQPLLSDHLFTASELNHEPGKVLHQALECPVTITRGGRYFVVMRRELAAMLLQLEAHFGTVVDLVEACTKRMAGYEFGENDEHAWLDPFDNDDLAALVSAVCAAFRAAPTGQASWDGLARTLDEWHGYAKSAKITRQGRRATLAKPDYPEAWEDVDE